MKRFIEGTDRSQTILFPAALDDYVAEDNAVRVIDVFVDTLNFDRLGFDGAPIRDAPPTIRRSCSRSTSTVISIVSSQAGAWSARHSAMSS